jgi:hypothetical protein
VQEAYVQLSKNYSDQPAKGSAKEIIPMSDRSLPAYPECVSKNYPTIKAWLATQGITLDDESDAVFILWDW